MSSRVSSIYRAIADLVRMAAKFLRLGDESRSERARNGIREISKNIGIRASQTQYPVDEILKEDLHSKIPQMNNPGWVLRYSVDKVVDQETETDEIWLELWQINRCSHLRVAMVGELFTIHVKWGSDQVRLNCLVMVDGVMTQGKMPAVLECGPHNIKAYTISRFDWEVFVAFSNEDNTEISAAQRLLYLAILDSQAFDFMDPDTFCCWPLSMIKEEMERHTDGQYYPRFTAERAGLVTVEENLDCAPGTLGAHLKEIQSVRRGQSPILNHMETMELVEQYEEDDREAKLRANRNNLTLMEEMSDSQSQETADWSPEILRGPVARGRGEKSKKKERGIRRAKKTVLTVDQFKAILTLFVEEVDPSRSAEEVAEEVGNVNAEKLTDEMNKMMEGMEGSDDVGEILRDKVSECRATERSMSDLLNEESVDGEDHHPSPGALNYQLLDDLDEDLEDEDDLEVDLDEMPELTSSSSWGNAEDWDDTDDSFIGGEVGSDCDMVSSKGYSPEGWSPLSMRSGTSTPPPIKRARKETLARSGLLMGTPSPLSSPATFSPFLTKMVDGKSITTVSTDESDKAANRRKSVRKQISFGATEEGGASGSDVNTIKDAEVAGIVAILCESDGENEDEELDQREERDDTDEEDHHVE